MKGHRQRPHHHKQQQRQAEAEHQLFARTVGPVHALRDRGLAFTERHFDGVLLPGLVNAHHHLLQSAFRTLPGTRGVEMAVWLARMREAYVAARVDPELVEVAGQHRVGYVCSHTGGAVPRTRPHRVHYDEVVADVIAGVRVPTQRASR